jgi:chromosome segregation ATPase
VPGWERAEEEIVGLKAQLNSSDRRNFELDERIRHLDGVLKECVRELRQVRSDQERKLQEALFQQSCQWESDKSDLELQVTDYLVVLTSWNDSGGVWVLYVVVCAAA